MANTEALFRIGDAADEAGNYSLALQSFERGASLGDAECLCRLAYMFDVGNGVETDKSKAMQYYQRAWRRGSITAGANIAILYKEQSNWRAMFRWWKRVADTGDGSAQLQIGKCYLEGIGVGQDVQAGLRCLAKAVSSHAIFADDREEAEALLHSLRPKRA